jgi:hypothetical protein
MSNPTSSALEAIQHAVLQREISVLAAQRACAALGGDPSRLQIPCEADGCEHTVPLGDSHSIIGVAHTIHTTLAVTGPAHVMPTQCDDEQHYGCSLEHALSAHIACLRAHVFPKHQQKLDSYHARIGVTEAVIADIPKTETVAAIAAELPPDDRERFLALAHLDVDAVSAVDQAWYTAQRDRVLHKWNVAESARRNLDHAATRDAADPAPDAESPTEATESAPVPAESAEITPATDEPLQAPPDTEEASSHE